MIDDGVSPCALPWVAVFRRIVAEYKTWLDSKAEAIDAATEISKDLILGVLASSRSREARLVAHHLDSAATVRECPAPGNHVPHYSTAVDPAVA